MTSFINDLLGLAASAATHASAAVIGTNMPAPAAAAATAVAARPPTEKHQDFERKNYQSQLAQHGSLANALAFAPVELNAAVEDADNADPPGPPSVAPPRALSTSAKVGQSSKPVVAHCQPSFFLCFFILLTVPFFCR